MSLKFDITKKLEGTLGRAGIIRTPHGDIETPAFITVGTKATVKSLTPEEIKATGSQVVLANTYHLHLRPGSELIKRAGGLQKFMGWQGPTMTDSGGFQVFSLGVAYGKGISKITSHNEEYRESDEREELVPKARITDEGVYFKSYIDGHEEYLTPEKSIEIQHNIGADIIFAFDECTSPHAEHDYQKEAMDRTHRWAKRCVDYHKSQENSKTQALFGVVQGGKYEDLRKESARVLGAMDFDGFGIGGSFSKDDIGGAVCWVNEILPEAKPRHLLGIGEPLDIFAGVEAGCDTFDCVMPTRNARNGGLFTYKGRINIGNKEFKENFGPIDEKCACYTCTHFSLAYLHHLFGSKEILANTLASIHNVHFIVQLVKDIRQSILDDRFVEFKKEFVDNFYGDRKNDIM